MAAREAGSERTCDPVALTGRSHAKRRDLRPHLGVKQRRQERLDGAAFATDLDQEEVVVLGSDGQEA